MNLGAGAGSWQLYDLTLDPFEANDIFELERNSGHEWQRRKNVQQALSGDVKELYIKHGYNLTAASVDIFQGYMDHEFSKGYRPPMYPHKLWSKIFSLFTQYNDDNFLVDIGFLRSESSRVFSQDYCEDLNVLRSRIDKYISLRNSTEWNQQRNDVWNEIDIRHVTKYF